MKKLLFLGLFGLTTAFFGMYRHVQVQATGNHNAVCEWNNLKVEPHPDPTNWNYTGEFKVTNLASFEMTFNWLLDMWGHSDQNQSGTTTLQPGESKVYGFGNICPKWQFDVWCGEKEWGAIVESHGPACEETQTTTTPTPTESQSPVEPTPTETQPQVTETPSPTVTPVPTEVPNPTPTQSSESNNSNNSNNSSNNSNNNDVNQVQSAHGSREENKVLGVTALADAGIFEDTFAAVAGIVGMFFTAAGYVLYAKKNI